MKEIRCPNCKKILELDEYMTNVIGKWKITARVKDEKEKYTENEIK